MIKIEPKPKPHKRGRPVTGKQPLSVRLDPDLIVFYRGLGTSYTQIVNDTLRAEMERRQSA